MSVIERLRASSYVPDLDRETVTVLLSIPVIMVTLWYFGQPRFFHASIAPHLPPGLPFERLLPFFYFSGCLVLLRSVVPWLLALIVTKRRPRDYGWSFSGTFDVWWGYVALFVIVTPFIWYASTLPSFLQRYPFGHEAFVDNSIPLLDFVAYQFAYLMIFVSGESYWRGFVLFGLERRFGYHAILVMVIPYCMTHFGKPVAEAYASILAGTALGYLALRHRSFWLGVAVHYASALLMDVLAIHARGIRILP